MLERFKRLLGLRGTPMRTNEELVRYLRAYEYLRTAELINAFEAVDRAHFVPEQLQESACLDTPLPTQKGQTISAPSVVALMTEALAPRPGHNLLEIGTGSGYQTTLLAHIVGPRGHVTTLEHFSELTEYARERVRKHYPELFKHMEFVTGDGSKGYQKRAPYDGILVTCGAPSVPKPLFEELKEGGRLVIPVGGEYLQDLLLVQKSGGRMLTASLFPVMFVPLVGEHGYPEARPPERREVG